MNYGQRFMTLYRRQESRPVPRNRNAKRTRLIPILQVAKVKSERLANQVMITQQAVTKTIPKKKKHKKAKWLSEEALQIAVKRREGKGKEKGKRKEIPI